MKKDHYIVIISLVVSLLVILNAENISAISLGLGVQFSVLLPLILIVIIAITNAILFLKVSKISKSFKILIVLGIPCLAIITNAFINPIYPEDFKNRHNSLSASEYPIDQLEQHSSEPITCIFLTKCPFCEKAAEKLDALYKSGQLKNIKIIYYAYQNTADSLVKTHNITIPYSVISDDSFFKLGGNSYPAIVYKQGDKVEFWSGNDVNFACFDYLTSLK